MSNLYLYPLAITKNNAAPHYLGGSIFVFCSEQKENENYAISGVLAKDNSF